MFLFTASATIVNVAYLGRCLPNHAVRSKGKPRLENESDNTGPVENETRFKSGFHIMPTDVVYDERERMEKRKDEEGVRAPAVEHLQPLVRDAGEQCDPVRLGCGRTEHVSLERMLALLEQRTRQMACMPVPSIPTW